MKTICLNHIKNNKKNNKNVNPHENSLLPELWQEKHLRSLSLLEPGLFITAITDRRNLIEVIFLLYMYVEYINYVYIYTDYI
jgi:hypothetical protein